MKIHLVRHAQSIWQLEPNTDWDTSLSPLGQNQAEHLAHWICEDTIKISGFHTSPLKRAMETTDILANTLNLPITIDPLLREANFHVAAHLPSRKSPLNARQDFSFSNSYKEYKLQVDKALKKMIKIAVSSNGTILSVAHGGFIKTLLRLVVDSDTISFRLYNTGITTIEWRRGRWHLVHLNRLDHLPNKLRTL